MHPSVSIRLLKNDSLATPKMLFYRCFSLQFFLALFRFLVSFRGHGNGTTEYENQKNSDTHNNLKHTAYTE